MSKQAMTFDEWFAEECPLMCKDDPWARTTAWSAWLAAWDAAQKAIKQHDAEPVAWCAWDDGLSRWDFTLWPDEQCNEGRDWEPLYLSAPSIPEGWQPIETAPKDGTPVLIYLPKSVRKVREAWWAIEYEDGPGFWSTPHCPSGSGYMILPEAATHWMPLPASPQPTKEDA